MGNLLKKVFSSFVALTTIAWSVGIGAVALPRVASAAVAGDLIKASGPAVYYYAADNRRYVFPNEKTYYSWFRDFSSVRTISDGELASILIGGNVTIRPGTRMVKIQTDPKTYAVDHDGVLHWVESEALASALYGPLWNQRIWDVPDAFFVNYSIGSSISTAVHPNGSLIMYAGSPDIYVMAGGAKRRFTSEAVFAANGYNAANVITTTIAYPNGTDVVAREGRLADVIYIPGGVPPVSGPLTVTLASDTPAGVTVPRGAASIPLVKFNFSAGSQAATIGSLTLRRVGVGATTDFSNVYLYNSNGTRITTGRTINSSTNLVSFNNINISVPAGTTVSLLLWGDISSTATVGGEHAFQIPDAASVVIGSGSTVTGNFPITGNTFRIGTTAAARLDVQKGTTPTNPQIGQMDAEISNFKLVANGNDIEVRRITLIQAGSVSNTDLTNLSLWTGSTKVAETAALDGDKIVLNFSPAYLITDGTTRTFSLRATVGGRTGRTIKTYVEYSTDVYAIDREFNTGAAVCITSSGDCTTGSFDGTSTNYIEVTTEGGQLTTAFNGPPTSNIAKGQQDVVLYRFALTSSDNDLEIRKMYFRIQGLAATDLVKGSAGTEYFRDIKVKNLDSGQVLMGPISYPSALASSSTDTGIMTFTDAFNIMAGQTLNLGLTVDLSNTEDATNEFFTPGTRQYRVVEANADGNLFGSSDVRITDTGEFLPTAQIVPNTTINGNYHTVKSSSLTVTLASTPTSATAVRNQQDIPAAGFVFTAGSESNILVRTVKLTARGKLADGAPFNDFALADANDVITQCKLFNGSTQVGLAESPDGTTGAMNFTSVNVTVPAGSSVTLEARCTADSIVAGTADYFAVGIAANADVTAEDSDSNDVTANVTSGSADENAGNTPSIYQTVMAGGTLTIATDNLRQSTILVAGGDVWHNFAQFKATAQFEAMRLERMMVTSTGDAANFTRVAIAQGGVPKGENSLSGGTDKFVDVDLFASPIDVPKDGSVTFQVWGKLGNVQSSSSVGGLTTGVVRSGNQVKLGLGAGETTGNWDSNYAGMFNVRAVGLASGDIVYATGADTVGNNFVVRKTKPTVTRLTLSTTTLANGTNQDLYKFRVSADSAGRVTVKKIVFDFSKNGTTFSMANFRIRKGSTDMALADYAIVMGDSGADLEAGSIPAATTTGRIAVIFTNEESVEGSGNDYTIYATPSGSVAGDTFSLSFTRDLTQTVTTGYLADGVVGSTVAPNIDTAAAPDNAADVVGYFVWSDDSEVPHSASFGSGTATSSRDWTNDVYVEDLTQTQTLTR